MKCEDYEMKGGIYFATMTGTGNFMSLSNEFFAVVKQPRSQVCPLSPSCCETSLKGTDGVSLQALHWIRGSNEDMRIL